MLDDHELDAVLTGDQFVSQMCLVCGMHAALFTSYFVLPRNERGEPAMMAWLPVGHSRATKISCFQKVQR